MWVQLTGWVIMHVQNPIYLLYKNITRHILPPKLVCMSLQLYAERGRCLAVVLSQETFISSPSGTSPFLRSLAVRTCFHLCSADRHSIFLCIFHIPFLHFFCFIFGVLFCFVFWDRVSLCSSGCPGTHSVDQAGLKLRNPPASASQVLGLKACTTTPGCHSSFLKHGVFLTQLKICMDTKSWKGTPTWPTIQNISCMRVLNLSLFCSCQITVGEERLQCIWHFQGCV